MTALLPDKLYKKEFQIMQEIEWSKLGFEFTPTRSNIRFHYANGEWSEGVLTGDYSINISVAANVLHYGQAIFEGMKAFRGKDGKVRIFRPDANGRRLNSSARQLVMPEFPVDKFVEAVRTVVKDNIDYDVLAADMPYDTDRLDEIVELISNKKTPLFRILKRVLLTRNALLTI